MRNTIFAHPADLSAPDEAAAEHIILELADYIYGNTSLKPMSKALFAVSRLLLVAHRFSDFDMPDSNALAKAYRRIQSDTPVALTDDYDFTDIVRQCEHSLPRIVADLRTIIDIVGNGDALGLLFNTLIRGKWESGEGFGTFLTPGEVVDAIVTMVMTANRAVEESNGAGSYAGDICGGTGRFAFALARALRLRGSSESELARNVVSFDQSSLATDYARINLYLLGLNARCAVVSDSLIADEVSALRNRCSALATNPPFGAAKYEVSSQLRREIGSAVLKGMIKDGCPSTIDPAVPFVFRNLDLLKAGGVLGIVLPDGIVRSRAFSRAMRTYEEDRNTAVEIRAMVSLPTVTFAFGGTVAKTSFLVISKEDLVSDLPLFVGQADNIGFLKRKNRRVADPMGNDLVNIVAAYTDQRMQGPQWVSNWRSCDRLGLAHTKTLNSSYCTDRQLRSLVVSIREPTAVDPVSRRDLHISVRDIDETGLIDVLALRRNRPASRVLSCQPGDILISCINPRIWRVTVVPEIDGRWTCSSEFLVLRPKVATRSWELAVRLHHVRFRTAVQAMAGGTSSSRQRVAKDDVLQLPVPMVPIATRDIDQHRKERKRYYAMRLAEGKAYEALKTGSDTIKRSFTVMRVGTTRFS